MICSYNGALCTILSRGHCAKSGKRDQDREMRAAVIRLPVHLASPSHSALTVSRQVISLIFQQLPGYPRALPLTHAALPLNPKEVMLTTIDNVRFAGTLVCVRAVPFGENSALPATRHVQVERG